MASDDGLQWNGEHIQDMVTHALLIGVSKALYEGMAEAKRLVHKDTRSLESAITIESAHVNESGQVEGSYGPRSSANFDTGEDVLTYAIFQEFLPGEEMPDGGTRERRGGKPYMRPSQKVAEAALLPSIAEAWRNEH